MVYKDINNFINIYQVIELEIIKESKFTIIKNIFQDFIDYIPEELLENISTKISINYKTKSDLYYASVNLLNHCFEIGLDKYTNKNIYFRYNYGIFYKSTINDFTKSKNYIITLFNLQLLCKNQL